MIIMNEERLSVVHDVGRKAVCPFLIGTAGIKQALPSPQTVNGDARRSGEAIEISFVDKKKLGGFGDGQAHKTSAHFTILQKRRHKSSKLFFSEVVSIIDKDVLIGQGKNGFWIRDEHIGQLRRSGFAHSCGNDAIVDVLVVRHHGDFHLNALFNTNRVVEDLDEVVERRVRLSTIDMPDSDSNRLIALGSKRAANTEQQPASECQHGYDADNLSHAHSPCSHRCLQWGKLAQSPSIEYLRAKHCPRISPHEPIKADS